MAIEMTGPEFSRHFRNVLGTFCSGVTVVTATAGPNHETPVVGLTCQSFFSVSIDPPCVAFSVGKTSTSFPPVRAAGQCCINILAADQEAVSSGFGRSGAEKWSGIAWRPSPVLGNPVIDGVVSWIDCTIEAEHEAGDHTIVIARIADMSVERDVAPLLFNRGGYAQLADPPISCLSIRTWRARILRALHLEREKSMRRAISATGWFYVMRRLLQAILVIWAAFTVTFIILYLVPGNPAEIIAGGASGAQPTPAELAQINAQYGFDKPVIVQYLMTLGHALSGNLGESYQLKEPVTTLIGATFLNTCELAFFALAVAVVAGLVVGGAAVYVRPRWAQRALEMLPPLGASLPSFWVGLMLMEFFSFRIPVFPSAGQQGFISVVLPGITLAVPVGAQIAQVFAKSLRTAYQEPFVEIAAAKGASRPRVFFAYAARNALLPVITVAGMAIANLFVYATIAETIFSRNGLGLTLTNAVQSKDIPVVQGVVLVVAGIYVLASLLVDLVYPLVDARIVSGLRAPRLRARKPQAPQEPRDAVTA
jgi:peptide/nickel transport system permease protein